LLHHFHNRLQYLQILPNPSSLQYITAVNTTVY
jgi:hypothetical protein